MGFSIMKALSRLLFAGVSIGGIVAGFTAPAHATLQFTVGISGTESSFTCVDNDTACDTNPAVGEINILNMSFDGLVGTDVVVQSSGNSGHPAVPSLSYSIGSFLNGSGENLDADFAVSDTDFRGPANLDLNADASFTSADGSNVMLGWFADPSNTQGGNTPTDAPGMELDDTEFEAPGAAASESMTVLSKSSLYSLSDQGTLFLVAGGAVSGGQSATFSFGPPVPEPSTWAMMILGFAGLGYAGWRSRRMRVSTTI